MDIWKYDSTDTAEYLYLHDCDCRHIYGCDNKLILEMEWMEILETHPDNPYNEAHQSGGGLIELLDCELKSCELSVGDEIKTIKSLSEIELQNLEILDFIVEKCNEKYKAKIYMIDSLNSEEFNDVSISLVFKHSLVKFNELNDISWFVGFNS